jgi:Ni,Fe-hydrogenase III component G
MTKEETLQQQLLMKFPVLEGKIRIQRERRLWVEVPFQNFMEIFDYAVKQLQLVVFCTMTGLDEGENLSFIYHLAQENGIMLNIKTSVPKTTPLIKTITAYFPAATLAEREVEDLLGAKVEGLPAGRRYPLPDDWPLNDHPLRKDWKPAAAPVKTEEK